MIERWDNVPGEFTIEFYQSGRRFLDVWECKPVHPVVGRYLKHLGPGEHGELVIRFMASGYHDSGSMYGGSDNLGWPPEGDEERVITEVFIETDTVIPIPKKEWDSLACDLNEEIYEVELEYYPYV